MARKKTFLRSTIKDQSGAGKIKIGELLRKEGQILSSQLEEAIAVQKRTGRRLGSVLVSLGYIEDDTVYKVLSRLHNYQAVDLQKEHPNPQVFKTIPFDVVARYCAFPLRISANTLQVTMAEPTDTSAVEHLQAEVKMALSVCVSTEKDILNAYRRYYKISDEDYRELVGVEEEVEDEEDEVVSIDDFGSLASEAAEEMALEPEGHDTEMEQFSASDAPIIKLVNGILVKAVRDNVSDIHIEPFEHNLQVRYRLDGSLYRSMNLPLTIRNALISRIKILSDLDITERRIPQDGRIKMRIGRNRVVDFRVSTLPTLYGESVVLRILDKASLNIDLTKLGLEESTYAALQRCLNRPQGLLLVTGPTGSGKTVTLYSALESLNNEDRKILTVEDPVEFHFRGINQVNVHHDVGMTFAAALRSFLRQDPDIIMVGEIRDLETAEIAIKASMTGHLVFSTLHTNDSPSTVSRMVDIGVPPYLLSSAITMVQSQRLGRRLCQECKVAVELPPREELLLHGFLESELQDLTLYGPSGCPACRGGGYRGRVGFFELMEVTDEVAKAINAEVSEDQLRKVAIQEGMVPLRRAAIHKAIAGVTSLDEVLRRTVVTEESLPAYLVNPDVELYEDGDTIIRQNNTDTDFFQLIQGSLMVMKDGELIAEIVEPNEYFGEMAAISGEPRSATIVSRGRTRLKRFPGDKIMEIIEKHPKVSKHLFKTLVSRLDQADDVIVRLTGSSS